MPDSSFSLVDALAKTSSLAQSLISALGGNDQGGKNSGGSLFDSLLDDANAAATAANKAAAAANTANAASASAAASNAASAADTANAASGINPQPQINSAAQSVQDFLDKWHKANVAQTSTSTTATATKVKSADTSASKNPNDATQSHSSATTDTASTTSATSTCGKTNATTTAHTSTTTTDGTSTASNSTDDSDSDQATTPDLSTLMASLQDLLQQLRQQTPTSTGNSATDGSDATDATGTSDDSVTAAAAAAAQTPANSLIAMVGDFLQVLQKLGTQSQLAANTGADANATTSTTASASLTSATMASLTTNLKSLLDALKSNPLTTDKAKNSKTDDSQLADLDADQTAAATDMLTTFTATTKDTATTDSGTQIAAQTAMNDIMNSAQDLLQQMNNLFTPVAASAASTGASSIDAILAGKSSDLLKDNTGGDSMGGSGNNAATATSQTNTNTAAVAIDAKSTGTYNFASQLSALRSTQGGTTGLPTAVDQVMLQLSRNVKSGNDQMSIQLHPLELGRIDIKLQIDTQGNVQGTVTASNAQTLDMLQKDSRGLERALQDAGLNTDGASLQFNLGDSSNQANGQNFAQQNTNTSGKNGLSAAATDDDTAQTVIASQNYYVTPGRVNLQV